MRRLELGKTAGKVKGWITDIVTGEGRKREEKSIEERFLILGRRIADQTTPFHRLALEPEWEEQFFANRLTIALLATIPDAFWEENVIKIDGEEIESKSKYAHVWHHTKQNVDIISTFSSTDNASQKSLKRALDYAAKDILTELKDQLEPYDMLEQFAVRGVYFLVGENTMVPFLPLLQPFQRDFVKYQASIEEFRMGAKEN